VTNLTPNMRLNRPTLNSLPIARAEFIEQMECLSVSKLPEGSEWPWEVLCGRPHNFFCGPRYVALAIGWQNRPTWPCAQRHIILYQRLCRNCINEASFFQCFEGTAPWTSQVASARVYCCEFGVYRHVRFGGCNVSLGVRVPLAP